MANKYTKGARFHGALGAPCCYCKRPMSVLDPGLFPTRDHVHPQSKGGQFVMWACDDCNHVKDNMVLAEWNDFMAANPEWWKMRKGIPQPKDGKMNVRPISETMRVLRRIPFSDA